MQQQQKDSQLSLSGRTNWSRYLKLPKKEKRMSVLRNGLMISARELKRKKLQH
jgi:hypothetical protein